MIELDVRRTDDAALVVHHDAALEDGVLIAETQTAALPDWLPSLEEAIRACDGMGINIEIKVAPAAEVTALIERLDVRDRVIVSSFDMATIDAVRAADPSVATAWLTFSGIDATTLIGRAVAGGHCAIHPHESTVTRALVDAAHAAGLELNTWTVDDPTRIAELAGWGVDGIVTNVPDVAVAVLRGD